MDYNTIPVRKLFELVYTHEIVLEGSISKENALKFYNLIACNNIITIKLVQTNPFYITKKLYSDIIISFYAFYIGDIKLFVSNANIVWNDLQYNERKKILDYNVQIIQ